jgi:hypothetical protein
MLQRWQVNWPREAKAEGNLLTFLSALTLGLFFADFLVSTSFTSDFSSSAGVDLGSHNLIE